MQPSPPDPAPEENIFVEFQRPWFPQWENKQEVSNPQTGYRLEGSAVNMVIYGFGLDPEEQLRVENRDTLGRLISGESITVKNNGSFYLRVTTELPYEFTPNKFYNVRFIRENGASIHAGSFYVAESPPDNFLYKSVGNLTYGFSCDREGKPYLLSWLSYHDGPNLLDTIGDLGREFQGDLVDGYPQDGDDFRWNTVIPCQGGGDYGRILPEIKKSQIENQYIFSQHKPLCYEPNRSEMNGPYRLKLIRDRWPDAGWHMTTEYTMSANDVRINNRFWHTDKYAHRVHQIRTAQVYLNPVFFQSPPLNQDRRVLESYLQAVIDDSEVKVYSDALGLTVTFTGDVDGHDSYFAQRQWNYSDYLGLADPGDVQIWESLNVAEINHYVKPHEMLSGWGKLTICEADKLGIGFDMDKFKEYLSMITDGQN